MAASPNLSRLRGSGQSGRHPQGQCDAGQGAGRRLGTRDAVASLKDITAKGPLTLKNVIVLGNPFRFTKDNIDQFDF